MLTVDLERLGLRRGHRLLDLGAGNGRHSFAALERGADVTAADLDFTAVQGLHEMLASLNLTGNSFARALLSDALHLPFAADSFDRIIVSEVMEHIPADRAALAEVARVLKPGGRVAITVPRYWPERVCWALSDEYHSNEGGHVRIYRSGELRSRTRAAGLEIGPSHHAHALHSPYWWLKCAFGPNNDSARLPRAYHRFLVWDIVKKPRITRALERVLDPVLGKSLVIYADRPPRGAEEDAR